MNNTLVMENIDAQLNRLRLPRIKEILPDCIKIAQEQGKSYLGFLENLLSEEVANKEHRRVENNLKTSGLPFIKTIDEFNFSFQPKIDRRQIMSLFDLNFIREKANIIFLGPPGVGKTHLAVALAVKACQAGLSIYSTTMDELIKKLKIDHIDGRSGRSRHYYNSALVLIDEVGYTALDREECNLFFKFVGNRYEKASTIITSNKSFSDWTELFHDPIIITAILDRLLHHSVVINIQGDSYRLKGNKVIKGGDH